MAAGFSLEESKIEEFKKFVGEYVKEKLGDEELVPVIEVDAAMDLQGATVEMAENLELLEPYGASNPEPKIVLQHVKIVKSSIVGGGHVRCFLSSNSGASLKAVAFKVADTEIGTAMLNPQGNSFHVAGTLRKDNWQGRNSVQFVIDDVMRV